MRRCTSHSGFFLSFLINLLLNLDWAIPGFVFLGLFLYFKSELFMWLMIASFALWFIAVLILSLLMTLACNTKPDPVKENKNPYSVKKATQDKSHTL